MQDQRANESTLQRWQQSSIPDIYQHRGVVAKTYKRHIKVRLRCEGVERSKRERIFKDWLLKIKKKKRNGHN